MEKWINVKFFLSIAHQNEAHLKKLGQDFVKEMNEWAQGSLIFDFEIVPAYSWNKLGGTPYEEVQAICLYPIDNNKKRRDLSPEELAQNMALFLKIEKTLCEFFNSNFAENWSGSHGLDGQGKLIIEMGITFLKIVYRAEDRWKLSKQNPKLEISAFGEPFELQLKVDFEGVQKQIKGELGFFEKIKHSQVKTDLSQEEKDYLTKIAKQMKDLLDN